MMPMAQDRATGFMPFCSEPTQEPIGMVPAIHHSKWHGGTGGRVEPAYRTCKAFPMAMISASFVPSYISRILASR